MYTLIFSIQLYNVSQDPNIREHKPISDWLTVFQKFAIDFTLLFMTLGKTQTQIHAKHDSTDFLLTLLYSLVTCTSLYRHFVYTACTLQVSTGFLPTTFHGLYLFVYSNGIYRLLFNSLTWLERNHFKSCVFSITCHPASSRFSLGRVIWDKTLTLLLSGNEIRAIRWPTLNVASFWGRKIDVTIPLPNHPSSWYLLQPA